MGEPALVLAPLDALEAELKEALDLCGGDHMKALRITLIANAFLEARLDELTAAASTGFSRGRVRKPAKQRPS
jgi:hypothetical protein